MQKHRTVKRSHYTWRWRSLLLISLLCCCVLSACAPAAGFAQDQTFADFSTHMPILVLEMSTEALESNGFFFEGTVLAYDGGASNTLDAAPAASLPASLRNMTDQTNASMEKCDYFLRLDTEDNHLLGLEKANEYLLLGGNGDKSLIRNYLGYQIAAGIMDDAPGFRLCEVFFRNGQEDAYQGVYLLVERSAQDSSVLFYHGNEKNGIAIDTYTSLNGVTSGKMYIPFIQSTQWEDRYGEIIGDVSTAESVLYSTNSAVFYSYTDLFDVSAFVNRFILGELMEDYVGVTDGYFYYDTQTELFSPAPIWDFSLSLDNQVDDIADVEDIRYDGATYFEQLFKSHQFASQIQRTYLILRRGILNEETLMRLIDDAAAYVAPAVQRDWLRWNAYSRHALAPIAETAPAGEAARESVPFSRQAATYEDEILRLKYQLREHSLNMAFNLTAFDFSEREISKEIVLNSNPIWLVLFLIVFFAFVRLARRYGV